jgi:hypothetical protein
VAVTRLVLRIPLSVPSVTVSLIVATLWWAAVGRWGAYLPTALLLLSLWVLSVVRRAQGHRP